MTIIRWEDPPDERRGTDWESIVTELRQRPGEWALVVICNNPVTAGSVARHVRISKYEALWGARFEAKSMTIDGEPRVYARYVGERTS